ncbi:hypothetical protein NLN90_16005 [Citrobacter portucalensis]|uniref:hypothetical protein n=1 Tax=Citrobacter portucalensis TaxID=1639133 RepID=UPI00226B319E|nr:hypothetical protein [Citrobacter portucalensis]MCX9057532.1 hypothetical protein [Citrobacter portucalensis]
MGRKERNPIKRIEQAKRTSKRKFTTTLKDYTRESIPGELITTVIEHPATVPVGAEFELLQDVLASSDNVFYKPRRRREYQIDSSQLRSWQVKGWENYADFVGYCQTWGLSHHTQDLDFIFHDEQDAHE